MAFCRRTGRAYFTDSHTSQLVIQVRQNHRTEDSYHCMCGIQENITCALVDCLSLKY